MASFHFRCSECGTRYKEREVELVCPACAANQAPGAPTRGALEVVFDVLPSEWPRENAGPTHGSDARQPPSSPAPLFADFLPAPADVAWPPLAVGDTPLLQVPRLRDRLAMPRLFVKDDTRNPSGSTKDRASHLVVAKAIEYGRDTVAAASTGNAASSLAAVSAAAGTSAMLFVPANAPAAKLVQMLAYGAKVVRVEGSYDDAFELCTEACERFGWYSRNTAQNPFTIEGKKTVALEIGAALTPEIPDAVIVPTGDGVIIAGVAKGFADLQRAGLIDRLPRLIAVQPEGADAIVAALRDGADEITPVPGANSVADSLVVQSPRNAPLCLKRMRETNGAGVAVTDDAIIAAIAELAANTGVFAEPAAAAALAGLHAALETGLVDRNERVVLLVTGNGLKDVPAASTSVHRPDSIAPDIEAVEAYLASR